MAHNGGFYPQGQPMYQPVYQAQPQNVYQQMGVPQPQAHLNYAVQHQPQYPYIPPQTPVYQPIVYNSSNPPMSSFPTQGTPRPPSAFRPPPISPSAGLAQQVQAQRAQPVVVQPPPGRPLPAPALDSVPRVPHLTGGSRPSPSPFPQPSPSPTPTTRTSRPLPTPNPTNKRATVDFSKLPSGITSSFPSVNRDSQPSPATPRKLTRSSSPTKSDPNANTNEHRRPSPPRFTTATTSHSRSQSESESSPLKYLPPSVSLWGDAGPPNKSTTIPTRPRTTSPTKPTTTASGSVPSTPSTTSNTLTTASQQSTETTPAKTSNPPIWKRTIPEVPPPVWGYAAGMVKEPHPSSSPNKPTKATVTEIPISPTKSNHSSSSGGKLVKKSKKKKEEAPVEKKEKKKTKDEEKEKGRKAQINAVYANAYGNQHHQGQGQGYAYPYSYPYKQQQQAVVRGRQTAVGSQQQQQGYGVKPPIAAGTAAAAAYGYQNKHEETTTTEEEEEETGESNEEEEEEEETGEDDETGEDEQEARYYQYPKKPLADEESQRRNKNRGGHRREREYDFSQDQDQDDEEEEEEETPRKGRRVGSSGRPIPMPMSKSRPPPPPVESTKTPNRKPTILRPKNKVDPYAGYEDVSPIGVSKGRVRPKRGSSFAEEEEDDREEDVDEEDEEDTPRRGSHQRSRSAIEERERLILNARVARRDRDYESGVGMGERERSGGRRKNKAGLYRDRNDGEEEEDEELVGLAYDEEEETVKKRSRPKRQQQYQRQQQPEQQQQQQQGYMGSRTTTKQPSKSKMMNVNGHGTRTDTGSESSFFGEASRTTKSTTRPPLPQPPKMVRDEVEDHRFIEGERKVQEGGLRWNVMKGSGSLSAAGFGQQQQPYSSAPGDDGQRQQQQQQQQHRWPVDLPKLPRTPVSAGMGPVFVENDNKGDLDFRMRGRSQSQGPSQPNVNDNRAAQRDWDLLDDPPPLASVVRTPSPGVGGYTFELQQQQKRGSSSSSSSSLGGYYEEEVQGGQPQQQTRRRPQSQLYGPSSIFEDPQRQNKHLSHHQHQHQQQQQHGFNNNNTQMQHREFDVGHHHHHHPPPPSHPQRASFLNHIRSSSPRKHTQTQQQQHFDDVGHTQPPPPPPSHPQRASLLNHTTASSSSSSSSARKHPQTPAPLRPVGIESPYPVGGRDKRADIPRMEEDSSHDENESGYGRHQHRGGGRGGGEGRRPTSAASSASSSSSSLFNVNNHVPRINIGMDSSGGGGGGGGVAGGPPGPIKRRNRGGGGGEVPVVPCINIDEIDRSPSRSQPTIQVQSPRMGNGIPVIINVDPPPPLPPTINVNSNPKSSNNRGSLDMSSSSGVNSSGGGVGSGPRIQVFEVPGVCVSGPEFEDHNPTGGRRPIMMNVSGPEHQIQQKPIIRVGPQPKPPTGGSGSGGGGGLICAGCHGQIIHGRIVSAMGSRWHPTCFKCTVCETSLEHVSSYEHEGRPYCHLDYHETFAPRCYTCKTAIIDEQFISLDDPALGKRTYHTQHFFCSECGDPFLDPSAPLDTDANGELALSGDGEFEGFTVYKGYPYCEACHVRLRLPKCKRCKKSIRDHEEAVEALGGKWCWACFVCAGCHNPFKDPSFFQRGDQPYCEQCFSIMLRNEI